METLSIEDGLSQGMIFDIHQTSDGFLWIATKDGLNRYDGNNFKIFIHDPLHPYSLSENSVTALFEDSRGWLWVGTLNKGIDLYHPQTGLFYHFPLNLIPKAKEQPYEVRTIIEAPDGSIYVLHAGNLVVRIEIPDSWEKQLPEMPDLSGQTQLILYEEYQFAQNEGQEQVSLCQLFITPEKKVWLYSNRKIYELLPETSNNIKPVDPVFQEKVLGKDSYLWGTNSEGLLYFKEGKTFIPALPASFKIRTAFAKPAINGAQWIALNNRLWLVEKGEVPDLTNPQWETDADISVVTTDRNGNIWIGTQGYCLRKINPRRELFHHGAKGTSIWGLWRDTQGRYYCKVINQIYGYQPQTGELDNQLAFGGTPKRVLDMCITPSGSYWLLGRDKEDHTAELRQFHPDTGESVGYLFPFDTLISTSGNKTAEQWFKPFPYARILYTGNGKLLIAGLSCHLVRFTPETANFERFDYSALFGSQAASVQPFALVQDGNDIVWIGTQQGLVKCTPHNQSYQFELIKASTGALNNNSIACLLPNPANPRNGLWIGTKGGGINYLNFQNGTISHITTQHGLSDDVVYGILPGQKNEIWCSTNRGLAKLEITETGQLLNITSFSASQGLQDNEFNTQAYFRADNGELLFGGVNGLNRFFPEEVLPDTLPPPVYLVGLRINHQSADFGKPNSPLTKPITFTNRLRLNYDQDNLTFEFAVLDYTDPSRNRYRYRLIGADKNWVDIGTYRFAHFTHLSPGSYTLMVEGSNGEGKWQPISEPFKFTILPPWWLSTRAYFIYTVLIFIAIWQLYLFQIRRVQMRQQLDFERRETERIKALEQLKTNFFSNITHEFRTPLTLMIEPLRQLLKNPDDPLLTEKIRLAEKNSRQLLTLVNQLLDMAKLESGSMTLDLRKANFDQTMQSVFEQFLPLAQQKQIQLELAINQSIEPFFFDADKVGLILNNLLSNALKFTPSGGNVTITCRIDQHQLQPAVQVCVMDTGIGIPVDELPKVFERFYQVNQPSVLHTTGTGIGLALTKELIELMGGKITVESRPENGTAFTFWLPLQTGKINTPPTTSLVNTFDLSKEPDFLPAAKKLTTPKNVEDGSGELPLVLIIEDNPELRSFIRYSLDKGWQIAEATNGDEGIKKAIELLPDIVISDLMMPLKDGYAVCAELKNNELTAHIPIILLTAKSALESKIEGLRTGADDYLTKPFNTEELMVRMRNLVEQRRMLRKKYAQSVPTYMNPGTQDSNPSGNDLLTGPDREFLHRFTSMVEKNLANEHLSVEEIAQNMFISRVQLFRKVKAITDQNVSDFVRNYRLEQAMAKLQKKEGLVYEIAEQVGFGSEKYFSRAFKEKFGISPSQVN